MKFVLIDFETASQCDLKKAGAARYAEDVTTEILCLGYTIDGEKPDLLTPDELSFGACATGRHARFRQAVEDPGVIFIAHNVFFEKMIWRWLMTVLGWPDLAPERWHDTMAVCAMKGLPLKLERAAQVLRLPTQKDTAGTAATLALGRTNKAGFYVRTEEKLQRVYAYCRDGDVPAELELHRAVRGLGAAERQVWLMDQEINERGVRLDMPYVRAAKKICADASRPLLAEFQKLTGIEKLASPKFKDWLVEAGCPFPRDEDGKLDTSLDKEHIARLLGVADEDADDSLAGDEDDFLPPEPQFELPYAYKRPLQIKRVLGSASVKKLDSMLACVCSDGQARGLLQYHGAGPGRWAGRIIQPQNFPRPTTRVQVGWNEDGTEKYEGVDPDGLVEAIMTADAEWMRLLYGEPIEAVASGLRHAIIAKPGHMFEVGDYAKIECVIVLALAGAVETAAKVIEMGSAVYTNTASQVFKRSIVKSMLKEYTIGKNIVLGCGFQMGWRKFKARYARDQPDEFCQEAVRGYREDFAPEVPKLWYALERAATECVWTGHPTCAYGIEYSMSGGWLTARLPSGRLLWYRDPKAINKHMPWCTCDDCCHKKNLGPETPREPDIRRGFVYWAQKLGQWRKMHAYGGLLTENVVQATARDLLVHGMFNARAAKRPIVLTVHDELITEVPEAIADAKVLDALMTDMPPWAKSLGIPVASDCWIGARYRK